MSDIHEQTAKLLSQLQSATSQAQTLAAHKPKPKPTYYELAKELASEAEPIAPVLDEFQDDLPSIDQPTHTPTNLPADNSHTPIGFELWEALAYDLALDHTDRHTIAEAYRLTVPQLEHLQANPYFNKMFQAKKDEIKQIGSDAAFVVKMRMVANRATPQFLRRLTDSSTSTKDFHALFKTAVELAQLMPQSAEETNVPQAVIGASVTFNIQGVPGLEHLTVKHDDLSTTGSNSDDITDAEFSEVVDELSTRQSTDDELAEL